MYKTESRSDLIIIIFNAFINRVNWMELFGRRELISVGEAWLG